MASLHVTAEELSCPVCCEIFKAPVLLSCSHSVCKECFDQIWTAKETQKCPVCRTRCSKSEPPVNLVLQSLCESFLKQRNESYSSGSEEICSLHNDKPPVCVEHVKSQQHVNHTFRPIAKAVLSYMWVPLKFLRKKLLKNTGQHIKNINDLIKKSILLKDGNPARYRLQTSTDNLNQSEPYRKMTFGERNNDKIDKTILMVGETGTGKTTLINVMINYILGVQREDKVWFEITDDQSNRSQAHSQTTSVTVYGFYLQESPIHLTIIDTPGYGDTRSIEMDEEIAKSLHSLSKSAEGIYEIHAVCLVIKATENRLSDRQQYIFDAVQSLFGRDIADNIVLLFTHSTGAPPKNALMAVEEAKTKCAVNDKNRPVFFLFDNCQSEAADEEYEKTQEQSRDRSFAGMEKFFQFLENIKPKTLKMTQAVLQQRTQLEANISNLHSRVHMTKLKQNELKQAQEALQQDRKKVDIKVPYKEKVHINSEFWNLTKEATCCNVCEENCHYPGCWWAKDLSWCSVMRNNHCTVCTNKCHYSKHIKEAKIYEIKTKPVKTSKYLEKKYCKNRDGESLVRKLKKELQELENEKIKLVIEAYDCVKTLDKIALKTDSLITLQHIDVLIENLKEINEPDKAKTLENIKKREQEKKNMEH